MKRKFVVNEHKYRYEEGAHYSYSIHNNNKKKTEKSESFFLLPGARLECYIE